MRTSSLLDAAVQLCVACDTVGRSRRALRLAGVGLAGTLGLTIGCLSGTMLPAEGVGASNPASLNCGTLAISGTNGNSYHFTEFTTGNASRGSNVDSGGSVAYGGNLTGSNFTVAQNISPSAGTLVSLVGGNETGQLNLQKGSSVVAGTASGGPIL